MTEAGMLNTAMLICTQVDTTASVHIEKGDAGFEIKRIDLHTEAEVPGIDEGTFQQLAGEAKVNCPVSKALAAVEITLEATLSG